MARVYGARVTGHKMANDRDPKHVLSVNVGHTNPHDSWWWKRMRTPCDQHEDRDPRTPDWSRYYSVYHDNLII